MVCLQTVPDQHGHGDWSRMQDNRSPDKVFKNLVGLPPVTAGKLKQVTGCNGELINPDCKIVANFCLI